MRVLRGLVTVMVTLVIAAPAGTAHAESRSKGDPADDAPASIDLRRVAYGYTDGTVSVKARVPDLGKSGRADLSITRFMVFEAGYVLRIVKHRGSGPKVGLYYYDHFSLERRACTGLGGRWKKPVIALSVPTGCLRGHARRRIRVQLGAQRGSNIDRAPAIRHLERD